MENIEYFEEREFQKGQIAKFEYDIKGQKVLLYDRVWDYDKSTTRTRKLGEYISSGDSIELLVRDAIEKHYSKTKFLQSLKIQFKRLNSSESPIEFMLG